MLTAEIVMDDADGMVSSSLSPESERVLPRTSVSVQGTDGKVTLTIRASDVSAMRAALNSYLGWMKITEDIGKMVKE